MNSEANAQRIATVENCFGSSGQPLAVPSRVLVGEGVLTKMCRKKPKPRQFFLFNDILVYGNIIIPKKKYNKQHIIPLEEVKLENLEDDGAVKNGWLVRTPTKSFAVYAATSTEKGEWMAHINKCVKDLIEKTGKKPSKEHAAVWVPDAEATVCMNCRKSQFTLINRRHHCRKCGAVVCNPCSNKKVILASQSSKPLRVCLHCYDELSTSKTDVQMPEKLIASKEVHKESNKIDSSGDDDSDDDDEEEHIVKKMAEDNLTNDLEEMHIQEKPTFYEDADAITKQNNSNSVTNVDPNEHNKQLPVIPKSEETFVTEQSTIVCEQATASNVEPSQPLVENTATDTSCSTVGGETADSND